MLIVLVMCAGILQVTAFAAEVDELSDGGESGMVSITLHDDKTTVAVNGNVVAENISLTDPDVPAADQTPAKDEATQVESLPELPEDGVQVDVETGRTEDVTVQPDDVPENAEKNEDGSYTWTETVTEGSGPVTTPCENPPTEEELADRPHKTLSAEDIKDKDGNVIGQKVVEEYTLADGTIYHKVSETYGPADGVPDETRTETQATQTTTTEATTQTTTVKPTTVTVQMSEVTRKEDANGNVIGTNLFDVQGATIVVKDSGDGSYAADVKLKLSGTFNANGGVTLTMTKLDGTTQEVTLGEVNADGTYTLEGIQVGDLTDGQEKTVKVTLTGKQIQTITQTSQKPSGSKQFVNIGTTGVETVDTADAEKIQKFLDELEITKDFVIYADSCNQTIGHIDGNICINELDTGKLTDITLPHPYGPNKDGSLQEDYITNGYSYVGQVNGSSQIKVTGQQYTDENGKKELATLVVGNTVNTDPAANVIKDQTNNSFDIVKLESDGSLKKEDAEKHPELADLADAINIDQNLIDIANAGQALASGTYTDTIAQDEAKLVAAKDLLAKGTLGKGDVVSVTIGIDTLTDSNNINNFNNNKYIGELLKSNKKGATIIINVNMSHASSTEVSINKQMHDVDDYDGNAARLIWNFGDYAGTIKFEGNCDYVVGRVVAPKAALKVSAIQSGSAVGKSVYQTNGEFHMAVADAHEEPDITTTTKEVETELEISLIVKVDSGEKTTVTDGGGSFKEIESILTQYNKPKDPIENPPAPENPDPENPKPDPDPDPDPDPRPDPDPDPDDPVVDIPDDPTPLTDTPNDPRPEDLLDIPDEDVPLADIPDEEVPLADVPATGDISNLWYALVMMSAFGLLALSFTGKRRKERV